MNKKEYTDSEIKYKILHSKVQVIHDIIGPVDWHGETYHDKEAYKNLDLQEKVLFSLVDDLLEISKVYGSHQNNISAKELYNRSKLIVDELKLMLDMF